MAVIIKIPILIETTEDYSGSLIDETDLTFRAGGRVEWTCEHGIGHTIAVRWQNFNFESWLSSWGVHGCDGCCQIEWD